MGCHHVFLLSDLQDDDEKLDSYYTLGNVFFLVHLTLLQAWIPAATELMATARSCECHYDSFFFVHNQTLADIGVRCCISALDSGRNAS